MNNLLLTSLHSKMALCHARSSTLIAKQQQVKIDSAGTFHKLVSSEGKKQLEISESEYMYLVFRLYFIYKKQPNISKQIPSVNTRERELLSIISNYLKTEKIANNSVEISRTLDYLFKKTFIKV